MASSTSSPSTPTEGERAAKVRRVRKHVSCIECRARKIKCDRNVPNCSSCVQRGLRDHCRWGDERDGQLPPKHEHESLQNATVYDVLAESDAPPMPMDVRRRTPLPAAIETRATPLAQLYKADREAWERAMAPYFAQLPAPHHMDHLVQFYLRELEPIISCMNAVLFWNEYGMLRANLAPSAEAATPAHDITERIIGSLGGASPRADPRASSAFWTRPESYALLGLLFVVLHTACDTMPPETLIARRVLPHGDTPDALAVALDRLHAASVHFVHESDAHDYPTLWTLQSIILLQRKALLAMRIPESAIWMSMALRLAQLMGLNRLGSAADDVARLQRNEPSVQPADRDILQRMPWLREFAEDDLPRRELGRKVWATLVMIDWLKSMHIDYTYMVPDEMNCTAPPAALTDDEVVRIASLPKAILRDPNRVSPSVFGRVMLELSRCVRQVSTLLMGRMSRHLSLMLDYADAMRVDRQINEVLARLPPYFRFDGIAEISDEVRAAHAQHPYLALQRLFLQEQIHFRLLCLHSPYLPLALRDAQYRRSLTACIEGARVTVAVWEELQRTENPNQQMHYMKWHLLSAAVVLDRVIGSMHHTDTSPPPSDYARLKTTLRKAVHFLESHNILTSIERVRGYQALGSLRQFCANTGAESTHDASTERAAQSTTAAPNDDAEARGSTDGSTSVTDGTLSHSAPASLQEEFARLGSAIPSSIDTPDWGNDDATLLAGVDFLMMNSEALALSDMDILGGAAMQGMPMNNGNKDTGL
ncbi:hypothetical protein MBRA1_003157 [Malassezia brasiliensis]|uniref:Zn(2)-C6 fungal-type domain-containing protein n=1 Tax=Malassezia brasiliensis TaxID=1821822 RepID=A0AAF0IQY0_9BASI|nr:hypothetical protein MBRA1_003157 [Malassezia brasiliensis]